MSENFADLFEESLKTVEMNPGAIITGVVIDIDKDWVTVHAGLKSEGVIPADQFYNEKGELEVALATKFRLPSKPLKMVLVRLSCLVRKLAELSPGSNLKLHMWQMKL